MTHYGIQKGEPIASIKIRNLAVHTGAVAAFFVPFDWNLVVLLAVTWLLRVIGVEAGYHRYFAHRAFKTSRAFQFFLAVLGASSGQRGPLWWALHHRSHHRHTDHPGDPHSPRDGFWHAHFSWLLDKRNSDTDLDRIPDFARYPELRWLNKFYFLPVLLLLVALAVGGAQGWFGAGVGAWQAVLWGFFLSTALALHSIVAVNSIGHCAGRMGGYRRYRINDDSVNHAWLAIFSAGGAWHNNHHRYGAAARAGFAWWELDISYMALKALEACRLVWELREVPAEILAEGGLGDSRVPTR